MLRVLTACLCVSIAGAAAAADAGSGPGPVAPVHGYGVLPPCDEPGVLARISEKFAYQDARITLTGLVIARIDGIHQHGLRAGGPGLIDRRYCGGTAWLSNGGSSEVVYLIETPRLGTFSVGWSVESCLPSYDPYRVYDARCRSIRP